MKVIVDGQEIALGTTETAPTISIVDFSKRETDDFGVTRIVERGFARRMSVRLALPFDGVDAVQRQLANLRAKPALWIADDRFDSLSMEGFYKDFALDLAVPPTSYCTLTVEGLTETGAGADTGIDPATDGSISTLQLLRPIAVTDAVLTATNVAENDYPEWSTLTTYVIGARVIVSATHSVFESVAASNLGNDPEGASGKWTYVGPTNRWAMFDQAVGTATRLAGSIVVTLNPGSSVDAVAILDATAATVRVQAEGYDRTSPVGATPGVVTFLDLPATSGPVTVTIAGPGDVTVGTLLIGNLSGLGVTEASPSAAITDFSRKATDDFGEVTVVERAWVKRMAARALIDTAELDTVVNRIAAVRAVPCLWIGNDGVDSLTIYGFFKDFSVEVRENTGTLSLSVEGLSTAARITPLVGTPGADGAPGTPGTDGQTLYTWIAYADNITGTVNFTTGFPDGRAYIGIAPNQPVPNESANPSLYTWSLYKGPANFGLVAFNANTTIGPNFFQKTAGTDNSWGTGAYSSEAFVGSAQLGFTCPQTNKGIFVGLNTDPTTNASYETIDYAFYLRSDGQLATRISGDSEIVHGPYSTTLPMQIIYDGRSVRWYHAGDLLRSVATAANLRLYLDSSIADVGGRIENVTWAAAGRAGDDGADGAPGTPGANGQTLYTHIAYADSADGNVNFTTGAPGGRAYVGIAPNKPTAGESGNPADYTWSQYKGPANFGLVNFNGNTIVGPNFIQKVGGNADWDASAYSSENFRGSAACSFTIASNAQSVMAGLNTDPTTNASYETIDFAFYVEGGSGLIYIYENGGGITTGWTHTPGTVFQIIYDGRKVVYRYGTTTLYREVTVGPDLRYYFDTSIAHIGGRIENITWQATGKVGTDAINNINRVRLSGYERGFTGWGVLYNSAGVGYTEGTPETNFYLGAGFAKITANMSAAGQVLSLGQAVGYYAGVTPGERLSVQVGVEGQDWIGTQALVVGFRNEAGVYFGGQNVGSVYGPQPYNTKIRGFITVPAGAKDAYIELYGYSTNAGRMSLVLVEPMIATATQFQTEHPPFTRGPVDGANGANGANGATGAKGDPLFGFVQDDPTPYAEFAQQTWYRPSYKELYRSNGVGTGAWVRTLGNLSAQDIISATAFIGDAVIVNAHIQNLTVGTEKVQYGAFSGAPSAGPSSGTVGAIYQSKLSISYTPYDSNSKVLLLAAGVITPTSQPGGVDYYVRIRRDGAVDPYPSTRIARSVANTFPAIPFTVMALDGGQVGGHTWTIDMAASANATGGADPATFSNLIFVLLELKR